MAATPDPFVLHLTVRTERVAARCDACGENAQGTEPEVALWMTAHRIPRLIAAKVSLNGSPFVWRPMGRRRAG
jgi:hypothetical protein